MNEEERIKKIERILTKTGYTTELEKHEVLFLVEQLQQENNQLKEELERLKQPTIFIDTQDMEERYGEELYKEYLENENNQLKDRIEKAYLQFYDMLYHQLGYKYDFDENDLKEIHKLEKILKESE